jgi:hypothetical protein
LAKKLRKAKKLQKKLLREAEEKHRKEVEE